MEAVLGYLPIQTLMTGNLLYDFIISTTLVSTTGVVVLYAKLFMSNVAKVVYDRVLGTYVQLRPKDNGVDNEYYPAFERYISKNVDMLCYADLIVSTTKDNEDYIKMTSGNGNWEKLPFRGNIIHYKYERTFPKDDQPYSEGYMLYTTQERNDKLIEFLNHCLHEYRESKKSN